MNFVLLLLLFNLGVLSPGDRSEYYQNCVAQCIQKDHKVEGLFNRLLQWTPQDDCKYLCMREHTAYRRANGEAVLQYHGKWPFVRILGTQEIASVVFSIGNAYAQFIGFRRNYILLSKSAMKNYWIATCLLNINAWLWSTVFHMRDKQWSEKMDYFSATSIILNAVYYSIVALFSLHKRPFISRTLLLGTIVFFVFHIKKLLNYFDYGYNMKVMGGLGVLFNALWILGYLLGKVRSSLSIKCGIFFLLAGSLEIFDFSPIFDLFDAHSIWHLCTIPITLVWWRFLALEFS
jgi:post-GPI attachment to proteins factor 3